MVKSCLGFLLLLAGIAGAIVAINADPALPDQVDHAWATVTATVHRLTTAPAAPSPSPAPIVVHTAPASPPAPTWSVYDCAFAVDTLTEDRELDARAFAAGLSPAADPFYYAREAAGWAQAASDAALQCREPGSLTGTACTAPPAAFALAITSHVGDRILHPTDAAWDAQWIAAYTRLGALWTVACPGDGA